MQNAEETSIYHDAATHYGGVDYDQSMINPLVALDISSAAIVFSMNVLRVYSALSCYSKNMTRRAIHGS